MDCVTDANVWIDLDHGGLLGRAFELGDRLLIPDLVLAELVTPDTDLLLRLGLGVVGLTGRQLTEIQGDLAVRYPRASLRDLASLVYARDHGVTLLTGDGPLRSAAREQGVRVHGVLWVLDRLVSASVVTRPEAARSLHLIVRGGAWLPKGEVETRLRAWEGGGTAPGS